MPRQVEVLSHPCIEVVSYCPSVLCTSNPAGAGGAHFADILGWSSQTLACLVGAGDVVHHIGVLTSDAMLDGPCLTGQGASVCVCIFGVNTTKTSCLSTLFEAWQCSVTGTSPPTMKYHATQCNTMQYHALPCKTMQYHASLITADGAYHCPVGSIMALFQSEVSKVLR